MSAPSVPFGFTIQTANSKVLVSWDLSAGATSYPVYRSTDNITFTLLATATATEYLDAAVTAGTQYWYTVSASNGTESAQCNSLSAVPTSYGQDSLGSLRLKAQQRADRVNSTFISTPEWNTYLNQSYFELYDLLKDNYEDWYFAVPQQVVTDGTNKVAVPADFYNLLGVDLGVANNNNAWVTLSKYDFIERNRFVYPNITSTFYGVFNLRYRLMGNFINFIPVPQAGQYIQIWYIPRMTELLQDTDLIDGVSGWTEYIIVDAAIKALQKEESDVSVLMAQKMALKQRIEEAGMNRDAGQPDTISNTRSWGSRNGGGGGPGFDGGFGGY